MVLCHLYLSTSHSLYTSACKSRLTGIFFLSSVVLSCTRDSSIWWYTMCRISWQSKMDEVSYSFDRFSIYYGLDKRQFNTLIAILYVLCPYQPSVVWWERFNQHPLRYTFQSTQLAKVHWGVGYILRLDTPNFLTASVIIHIEPSLVPMVLLKPQDMMLRHCLVS